MELRQNRVLCVLLGAALLMGCSQPSAGEGGEADIERLIGDEQEALEYSKALIDLSPLHDALADAGVDGAGVTASASLKEPDVWHVTYRTTKILPAYSCSVAFTQEGRPVQDTFCDWNK